MYVHNSDLEEIDILDEEFLENNVDGINKAQTNISNKTVSDSDLNSDYPLKELCSC